MPSKTEAQARAMAAACKGKSTLAIPKRVGCDFYAHDRKSGILRGKKKK